MIISKEQPLNSELKLLFHHIYEYKKGIRKMVLFTMKKQHLHDAISRLKNEMISYYIQPLKQNRINLFLGDEVCIETIRRIVNRPLNKMTPEEDFMIGALLGYDLKQQCQRYNKKTNDMACLHKVV